MLTNSTTHFKETFRNKSLLFQFIVSEFISAYQELVHLRKLVNDIDLNANINPFDMLSSHITRMSGPFDEYRKLFLWNFEKGMLTKLKRYCQDLIKTDELDNRQLSHLEDYVNKTLLYCLHGLDLLSTLKDQDSSVHYTNQLKPLLKILEKIEGYLIKISAIILSFVPSFRGDENVIFFLLKNHRKLSEIYGPKVTVKLFGKMFPKGLPELENFLYLKYKRRGFTNLLPIISQKISEVKHSYA